MRLRLAVPLLIVALCGALLGGCGGKNDESELRANPWVATYVAGEDGLVKVLEGSAPTVFFRSDDTVIGNAGVNTFEGDYVLERRLITVGSLVSTQWDGPQMELMQEQAILNALKSAERYAVAQDELVLYAAGSEPVMRLGVAAQPELTGPMWLCTSHADAQGELVPVEGTTPVGLQFAPDGELAGTGHVSRFTTAYSTQGAQMTLEPWTPEVSEGASPDLLAQDEAYYAAILQTATYRIEEYRLELVSETGDVIAVHIPFAPKN